MAHGMTQADLAGSDFTKGFISLLETGRTRVSLRAAEVLAARLGISAPDLLGGTAGASNLELAVVRADQYVAAGRSREALEQLTSVIESATGTVRARALRARGRALLDLGRPREALAALEDASHAFEVLGQREQIIRTLYDRALAHSHLDEPGNALALALECESGMRVGGLVDRTLELQVRSFLAAVFARAGDLESAERQAQQALQLANDVVDNDALGTLYSTLSVARQRQGQLDDALKYARKSLALFEDLGRDRAVAQLWHNVAAIHVAAKEPREAEKALLRAEGIASKASIGPLEARLLSLRAELSASQRRWREAGEYAERARKHVAASAITKGRALLVQARVLANTRGKPRAIRTVLLEAERALANEPPATRAEVHDVHAQILATRHDWRGAYEESRRAFALLQPKLK